MGSLPREPIAIIGSGCRFPGDSSSPSKLWELLKQPREVARPIDRFNSSAFHNNNGHYHGASNVSDAYLLTEDPRAFDAQFFNIQPGEAESIDPQQRLLLETVYESLETAGLALEDMRGSSTAVFVGVMCDDYGGIAYADSEAIPTYAATGIARSILSNRVSYVFDWRGPSMTIDTACSSSLVAVHQAIQVLRDGTSKVAIAAGANLIFSPNMFIAESNLNMLSATGKSQMWDQNANGYARGEGIASVVLKPLSAAIADGDDIECIIRETGLNQDGHTPGITMPSSDAQTRLIQDTYARAGLDLRKPTDRCQYFEAHGTGTKAGDGVESRAIFNAFFPSEGDREKFDPLYVGSVKTIIGHTEGTAGLAGVLKASLAVRNRLIPPNLHFKNINPEVAPYYGPLQIQTTAQAWPTMPAGTIRRASVNSFGFGGANAHAIIEAYEPAIHGPSSGQGRASHSVTNSLPVTFSATSEKSLGNMLKEYSQHLKDNPEVDILRLAWTLHHRRSTFPFRAFFPAQSVGELDQKIEAALEDVASGNTSPFVRGTPQERRLLGVFTGQGAQWATMGRELIKESDFARKTIARLERSLELLPRSDRPSWSLVEQLMADPAKSRIAEGELSQPLCTAVQLIVIDMLKQAGVEFDAVVGHSSGEIGAAYAAGFIKDVDAIRVAYFRGRYAHLARGPQEQKGGMMAVGTSMDDAQELCDLKAFKGRLGVAACNSTSSITLSGDEDAVKHAQVVFADEQKFNRLLKVDTAYHSHHMAPCSVPYRKALAACNIQLQAPNGSCRWYSSVYNGKLMSPSAELKDEYWVRNMVMPVLFAEALESALKGGKAPTMAIEVGPHPALKGPASSVVEDVLGSAIPYTGTLTRGVNDVDALAATLGHIWATFGRPGADLASYRRLFHVQEPQLLKGLPSYPWNHDRTFWFESRESRIHRYRKDATHPLLGVRALTTGENEFRWRNYLNTSELPWLSGHKISGQTLFPAAGFLVMAVEAAIIAGGSAKSIRTIELLDSRIHRALGLNDDKPVETLFSLCNVKTVDIDNDETLITAEYTCDASPQRDSGTFMTFASGQLQMTLGASSSSILMERPEDDARMIDVDVDMFYANLAQLGYNYADKFRGISSLKRTTNSAAGAIDVPNAEEHPEGFLVHPSALDVAFQGVFAALSYPGDGALWTLHIPTTIRRVTINPVACPPASDAGTTFAFSANCTTTSSGTISGDVDLFPERGSFALAQVEGLEVTPLSPPTKTDDRTMFAETHQFISSPDADAVFTPVIVDEKDQATALQVERLGLYCLRKLVGLATKSRLRDWAHSVIDRTTAGLHPTCKKEWLTDTWYDVESVVENVGHDSIYRADVERILKIDSMLQNDDQSIVEGLLSEFYRNSLGASQSRSHLASIINQLTQRFPHMKVLELGAGDGNSTNDIMKQIGSFSTYVCSDASDEVVDALKNSHEDTDGKFSVKTLDLDGDMEEQGFTSSSFHLIIAANGYPATRDQERALRNAHFLLKPGGYLAVLQATNPESLRAGLTVGALTTAGDNSSWHASEEAPIPTLDDWDSLLRSTGFSGIDTAASDAATPFSVFVSQAMDKQMEALRYPLASQAKIEHILLIGGRRFPTAQMVQEVRQLLAPFCSKITAIKSLDELQASTLESKPYVLSLTELDDPFFSPVTERRLKALKTLFDRSRLVLWVVQGANGKNPHGNMMKGVVRSLLVELQNLFCQIFNVESNVKECTRTLAEALLRLHIADSWASSYDAVWTMERELTSKDGKLYISRYLPNASMNAGYNTIRREVMTEVSPKEDFVMVTADKESYALQHRRNPDVPKYGPDSGDLVTVSVQRSILSSLHVNTLGYFHLSIGVEQASGNRVLVLSDQHQSVLAVPRSRTVPLYLAEDRERTLLLSVACSFAADFIVGQAPVSKTLIVHEPSPLLAHFVARKATQTGVHAVFTTTQRENVTKFQNWVYINIHSPNRLVDKIVSNSVAAFVACTVDEVSKRIESRLPFWTRKLSTPDFLGQHSAVNFGTSEQQIHQLLLDAVAAYSPNDADLSALDNVQDISLHEVSEQSTQTQPLQTIDWNSSTPVTARATSAIDEVNFRDDRTYFLIGMTGDLGISTVTYMISRGARYFALSSRSPKVDEKWLQNVQERFGATIRIFALDITDRSSLRAVHKDICETMPPIAGVANAALVMRDGLFLDMEAAGFNQALGPKMHGSIYLDELFSDTPLDFFILYSSLVFVTGNTGQVAYSAGNAFMVSLTHGRRARGQVGSVMGLAGISGIGYITRTDHNILNRLDILGYGVMSEWDYCYFFAEAVLAGKPGSGRNPEVSAGVSYVDPTKETGVPKWIEDPKFGHFRLDRRSESETGQGTDNVVSMKAELLEAKSEQRAFEIVLDALLDMIRKKLRLPADESVPSDVAIIELGVDSLVAVEMRSWLANELDANIPVVKILGGATLADLADDAVLSMPRHMIPNVAGDAAEESGASTTPEEKAATSSTESGLTTPGEKAATSSSDSGDLSDGFDTIGSDSLETPFNEDDYDIVSNGKKSVDENEVTAVLPLPTFSRTEKMSIGSSRFWFLRQYLQDDTCFNVVFRARITGKVDVPKVEKVVRQLGNRHHALRSAFYADVDQDNEPMVGLMPESLLKLEAKTIGNENEAIEETHSLLRHRFDIERGEVIRMMWLSLSPQDHIFVFGAHHIAVDGFSFNIIFAELDMLYRGQPMPPIQRQFTDIAVEQRREIEHGDIKKELAFWKKMYPDIPAPLPLFPLAGVGARRAMTEYEHDEAVLTLDRATANKIRAGCRANRSTPFHFFLATLEVFLFQFLDTEDICIGIADANRKDVNTLATVGFLLNLLPLRFQAPKGKALFKDVLSAAKKLTYSALEHSKLPFDKLLEVLNVPRSPTHSPMFQAFADYRQLAIKTPPMLDGKAEGERFMGRTAYDITLDITDISGSDISINLHTQRSLYPAHAEVLLQSYMRLVRSFADNFEADTTKAPLFRQEDITKAVELGRGPYMTPSWPETVSLRIDDICTKYPGDIALRDGLGNSMTYGSMRNTVNAISNRLLQDDIKPGDKVGVFQEPSSFWVCSLLAIWRIGAVYFPLNPRQSLPVLANIVRNCKPVAIISSDVTAPDVPALGSDAAIINVNSIDLTKPAPHRLNKSTRLAPAVILFTSGSTGTPKGIELCHGSLVNEAEGYQNTWDVGRPVVLQQSAFSFDVSLDQMLTGLANGGSLYVASAHQRQDPREVAAIVAKQDITCVIATPSEYANWISHASAVLAQAKQWRWACVGGEHWNDVLRASINDLGLSGLRLQNTYGPAEMSLWCSKIQVPLETPSHVLPAGHSMPNYSIYIVDKYLNVVPTGVLGEIAIGGAGAAIGYFNNEALTREKFVHDPNAPAEYKRSGWTRMYRTGDMGYLRDDGVLIFHGRISGDTQVKIRGVLVELEDVEINIVKAASGAIARAIASVRGEGESKFIVAFVEFAQDCPLDERTALLAHLLGRLPLPPAMTPAMLVEIDSIPLNAHNKVDRRAIKELPLAQGANSRVDVGDLTETELALRQVWIEVLPQVVSDAVLITRDSDFFHVGGNSLMAVRLQKLIKQTFDVSLPLAKLIEVSNLSGLAHMIDSRRAEAGTIDWDAETSLDSEILAITPREDWASPQRSQTVLLTGGSGFQGGHVLQVLVANPEVTRIHVVAVLPREDNDPRRARLLAAAASSDKVVLHAGDLSAPLLGLAPSLFASLAAEVDVIIHSGANRSFWGDYDAMRPINVSSTKELVRMGAHAAAQHGRLVPFHFLSSGQSFGQNRPPTDGSLGYVSSKWASERYLQNASAHLGLPVSIHRLLPTDPEAIDPDKLEALFSEFADIITRIKTVPASDAWSGRWDLMPVRQLATDIVSRALAGAQDSSTRIVGHRSTLRITMGDIIGRLENVEKAAGPDYREIPAHLWVGEAKAAGLSHQFTTMEMSLLDGQGEAGVVAR